MRLRAGIFLTLVATGTVALYHLAEEPMIRLGARISQPFHASAASPVPVPVADGGVFGS